MKEETLQSHERTRYHVALAGIVALVLVGVSLLVWDRVTASAPFDPQGEAAVAPDPDQAVHAVPLTDPPLAYFVALPEGITTLPTHPYPLGYLEPEALRHTAHMSVYLPEHIAWPEEGVAAFVVYSSVWYTLADGHRVNVTLSQPTTAALERPMMLGDEARVLENGQEVWLTAEMGLETTPHNYLSRRRSTCYLVWKRPSRYVIAARLTNRCRALAHGPASFCTSSGGRGESQPKTAQDGMSLAL